MTKKKYEVLINDEVVARNMDINTATILTKALFNEYYNDHAMVISIKEEDRKVCE